MIDLDRNKKELLYELIFDEKEDYLIDISNYIEDIYEYESFIKKTKEILEVSKVDIVKSTVKINSKTATWELKVIK